MPHPDVSSECEEPDQNVDNPFRTMPESKSEFDPWLDVASGGSSAFSDFCGDDATLVHAQHLASAAPAAANASWTSQSPWHPRCVR